MHIVTLEVYVGNGEYEKYGEKKVKALLFNILERYANEEYYEPDIIEASDDDLED